MPKGIYYDTIRLCAGHSLILGHCPEKLKMDKVNSKIEQDPQDLGKFGLFDSSSPNYTTYYPEVTANDLNPKDEEFIEPIFRMLSNVTVNPTFNPIYFSSEVLKKSMYKLIGQTVNIDHEMAVGNAIGSISAVEWQNPYTTKDGIKVPGGINGNLKIDGKSNPRIARGIMMNPPSINANSVTVTFAWKKSHPNMSDEEFWGKLATFDSEGKFIQRVVTEIQAYHETSLVGHGADPFAQKIGKDGKIVNPAYAKSRYSLSDESLKDEETEYVFYDWKQFNGNDFGINLTSNNNTINNNNQTDKDMKTTLLLLEAIFGFEANSLTEENYEEKLKTINTELGTLRADKAKTPVPIKVLDLEGLQAIETEITTLRTFKAGVPTDMTEKLAMAKIGSDVVTELREDTKRLYKLSVESTKEDVALIDIIDKADHTSLKALHKQYDTLTDGKFKFTCTKCGTGEHVTRASASAKVDEPDVTNKSMAELVNDLTSVKTVDTKFIEGQKK
jgi:hypothetical protein